MVHYQVDAFSDNGLEKIGTIDDEGFPLLVSGHIMKLYKKTMTKDKFIDKIQEKCVSLIGSLSAPNLV